MLDYYFWKSFLTRELSPVTAAPSIKTLLPVNTASSIMNIVYIYARFRLQTMPSLIRLFRELLQTSILHRKSRTNETDGHVDRGGRQRLGVCVKTR